MRMELVTLELARVVYLANFFLLNFEFVNIWPNGRKGWILSSGWRASGGSLSQGGRLIIF